MLIVPEVEELNWNTTNRDWLRSIGLGNETLAPSSPPKLGDPETMVELVASNRLLTVPVPSTTRQPSGRCTSEVGVVSLATDSLIESKSRLCGTARIV